MTALGILQIVAYFVVILAITKPVGAHMAKVFEASGPFSIRCCAPWNASSTAWLAYARMPNNAGRNTLRR